MMRQNGHKQPVPFPGVPDLARLTRPAAPARWVCTRNPEHVFTGDSPRVMFRLNPMAPPRPDDLVMLVTEVCLFCIGDDLSARFPVVQRPAIDDVSETNPPSS